MNKQNVEMVSLTNFTVIGRPRKGCAHMELFNDKYVQSYVVANKFIEDFNRDGRRARKLEPKKMYSIDWGSERSTAAYIEWFVVASGGKIVAAIQCFEMAHSCLFKVSVTDEMLGDSSIEQYFERMVDFLRAHNMLLGESARENNKYWLTEIPQKKRRLIEIVYKNRLADPYITLSELSTKLSENSIRTKSDNLYDPDQLGQIINEAIERLMLCTYPHTEIAEVLRTGGK